jgi:hypothetical protein
VFDAAQKSTANMTPSQPLPLLVSYLHILEMADGIEVLLSQCSVNPAIPFVRSMFESNLAIEYMLTLPRFSGQFVSWTIMPQRPLRCTAVRRRPG